MRHHINSLDEYIKSLADETTTSRPTTTFQLANIYLGAPEKSITVDQLEQSHTTDSAFSQFRKQLTSFINEIFPRPDRRWQQVSKEFKASDLIPILLHSNTLDI